MKNIRILFILFALLAAPCTWAAGTTVSGIVDGETWTATGSPYSVTGDVTVSSLVIQPGVEVQFQGNYEFRVDGLLKVNGTTVSPVKFTSTNVAVGWQGIWFVDSQPGSYFANCIIENAKNSAVRITNSPPVGGGVPTFTNCTILNNSSPAFGGAIDARLRSGDLIIENCVIRNNTSELHGGGINAILDNGTLKMVQCTIVSNIANVAVNTLGPQVWVGGGVRVTGNSILLNCVVSDNVCNGHFVYNTSCGHSWGGGFYSDTGNATLRNCRLERNTAHTLSEGPRGGCSTARGGAIYLNDGHLTMQNCIVATNSCSGAYDENSAAGIYVLSGTADIINCTIVANNTQGMNSAGTVNLINTIVYFNNGNAEQIAGTFTVTYSDIQGGYVGQGNISVSPNLRPGTLELLSASPLIDMGSPDPRYNDSCFPPSRGTARNDMGAYGGPSACCWASPCGLPVITSNPQSFTACINTSALLCIAAIGDEPLRYQWFYYGTNATNVGVAMAGATNACLTLSNVQSNQAGYYSVTVANAYGTADSTKALLTVTPVCVDLNLHAGLKLTGGNIGQVYQVQYLTNINSTTWLPLTTITQQVSGVFVFDPEPATLPRRFYRVIP